MKPIFINYKKCSTCIKAKKWLEANGIEFEDRQIVENNPTVEELKNFVILSKEPVKKFFNTSGNIYKEQNLKEKLLTATEDEMLELLSSNGMLVKRPLLVTKDIVLIGFKEDRWKEYFSL